MIKPRDASEHQDMYRRALAAYWTAQPGEMPADECIEDLFAGGDGWVDKHGMKSPPKIRLDDSASGDDNLHRHHHPHLQTPRRHHRRTLSGGSGKSQSTITGQNKTSHMAHKRSGSNVAADAAFAVAQSSGTDSGKDNNNHVRAGFKPAHDLDEFEIREDLVAWSLPAAAV